MNIVGQYPRVVREIENAWITLSDGCRLAARIWLPADAESDPVPAILEYLPYRKRDGTVERDELTHPYTAGHGYACVRVDMRGNGDSEGLMWDEYLAQEQDDALEAIDWITAQPWCSGRVGMMGISWGGFNALQVAARRPEALKAIITLCSTDDRYADDIHYKGGCLLNENLGWASTMLAYSSRPPDPELVGEAWRRLWLERLENMPLLVENWLRHPRRDDFWKHGSVCEDFAAIKAAVLAVGGWGDAYSNAVPRLLTGLEAPVRGLTGPWIHKYPHFAVPDPAIGFLQEALRWWDHWLKGRETGIMQEPLYRAYMLDSAPPRADYRSREGRWISEAAWPSPEIGRRVFSLNPGGLEEAPAPEEELPVFSPQDCGLACGEYCAMWAGPEWPSEQRYDDAGSLVFDSAPLGQAMEIFGAPLVQLEVAAARPKAFLAARLCDVAPNGESTRVTYGILNLAHRDSHERPSLLEPGRRYSVRIQLDDIAYAFPAGHRIRLAISNSYWPLIWPSPESGTVTLTAGTSELVLPERARRDEPPIAFEAPEGSPPLDAEVLRPTSALRRVERDLANGETRLEILCDFGAKRIRAHGHESGAVARETYRILPDDPLSARAEIHWTETLGRGDWQVRTESRTEQWSDRENFHIRAELDAYEGEQRVFRRTWERSIPRDML
jgi:putative CocE/NonD family hydrolase